MGWVSSRVYNYNPVGLLFPCRNFPRDDWFAVSLQQKHKLFWWRAGHWKNVCVISRQIGHISLCSYLKILTASAFHPHFPPAELRTHLCREKSHLLLWRRSCCLSCRSQLLWNLFSMFVGTAILWSNFSHNVCVLLQVEIVSIWTGTARTNTPKLRTASTSHLFQVLTCFLSPRKCEGTFLVSFVSLSWWLLWWVSTMESSRFWN